MDRQTLKQKILDAVDNLAATIIDTGRYLYDHPELGYKEEKGTAHVAGLLGNAGYDVRSGIARTGLMARDASRNSGPTLAVMGELDAIICKEHPDAVPGGAVHACGHNIQTAVMSGIALALKQAGALEHLGGNLVFMAVPAEEFVEMEFRSRLKARQEIRYFGGKQEMVARGLMDGIDMALMMHALNLGPGKRIFSASSGNGFIGKAVVFKGKEAHAGSAPHEGVNALNAAMLAMNNIHAQREVFRDGDRVRVHPIITRGGDVVNVVPARVEMECYVRAATMESLIRANATVDRALKAGAAAVGAGIEIRDMPGYLPLRNDPGMESLFLENADALCRTQGTADAIVKGGDFSGSLDFGDISHLIPGLHPFFGGVSGSLHSKEFRLTDPDTAYLLPVKTLALTLVDLLWDDGKEARRIIADFTPAMDKTAYLGWLEKTERKTVLDMEPCCPE